MYSILLTTRLIVITLSTSKRSLIFPVRSSGSLFWSWILILSIPYVFSGWTLPDWSTVVKSPGAEIKSLAFLGSDKLNLSFALPFNTKKGTKLTWMTYSQLSLRRPPWVQEKVVTKGNWSLKRKIKTKECRQRNKTVIYKVVA